MTVTDEPPRRSLIRWPLATAVIVYFAALEAVSLTLPARVPLHWGADGRPNSFGTPAQFAGLFATVGIVLMVSFVGTLLIAARGPLTSMNVPHPEYWKAPERQHALRAMLREDLNHLFTATYLLLLVVLLGAAASAQSLSQQLGWIVPVAVTLFVLFVLGYVVYLVSTRYRVPHQA